VVEAKEVAAEEGTSTLAEVVVDAEAEDAWAAAGEEAEAAATTLAESIVDAEADDAGAEDPDESTSLEPLELLPPAPVFVQVLPVHFW
jgi:hypothetical protein